MAQRTLHDLVVKGEKYFFPLDGIQSNVLYFRIDWGDGWCCWWPMTDSRGRLVKGRSGATLNKQLLHWDAVVSRAVAGTHECNARNGAKGFDVSWGWAIRNESVPV